MEKVHDPGGGFGPSPLVMFFCLLLSNIFDIFFLYIPHKKIHGPLTRGGWRGWGFFDQRTFSTKMFNFFIEPFPYYSNNGKRMLNQLTFAFDKTSRRHPEDPYSEYARNDKIEDDDRHVGC